MEEIELPYPNKKFKIEEIWIDLSKQSIWKMKEIKIKAIKILGISNSLKFWNSWSKYKVRIFVAIYCVVCGPVLTINQQRYRWIVWLYQIS